MKAKTVTHNRLCAKTESDIQTSATSALFV